MEKALKNILLEILVSRLQFSDANANLKKENMWNFWEIKKL